MIIDVTAPIVETLRGMRPNTHEIGGTLELDPETKRVLTIRSVEGEACRDPNGVLLSGKVCSVLHPSGPAVFHTHPRANRPSSTDLKIAIISDHLVNLIVTGLGIWAYAPTAGLRQKYVGMSSDERRCLIKEYRFLGHMEQDDTQQGDCSGMLRWMRKAGFQVTYMPYSKSAAGLQF